jgi:dihydrofolate synthase/folylpolyglutamate synthase
LRAGAYLSPHLEAFSERIEIAGRSLAPERFGAAVGMAAEAAELVERGLEPEDRVTQFEALTAAAYLSLAGSGVDVAVVEAGLGGRYDATSVINPKIQVLTNVGLEHTRWLGPTERHIAEEKLAVVPRSGKLVAGGLGPESLAVVERLVSERSASLVLAGNDFAIEEAEQDPIFAIRTGGGRYERLELRPLGHFQRSNYAVAVAAAETYLGELDNAAVRDVAAQLTLPGRLELIEQDPLLIFDGAHNPAGARALRVSLEPLIAGSDLTGVMSILDDKDAAGMLSELLPICEQVVFTSSSHDRALPPATLASLSRQLCGPPAEVVADPFVALERGRAWAGAAGSVLVTGSIRLLSDLVRGRRSATEARSVQKRT